MESELDLKAIHEIICLDDEDFENATKSLDLKELLCLMECLQGSMCSEQLHFEQLSRQLQLCPAEQQRAAISAALCTTQSLLASLLTKHIICSSQRSLRSSFDEDPSDKVHSMASLQNGFKERLRFFQSQSDRPPPSWRSSQDAKPNVPSVDNILSNVKTICSNRNTKPPPHSDIVEQSHHKFGSSVNGIISRTSRIIEQKEHSAKPSLLSNFNPSLEFTTPPKESSESSRVNNETISHFLLNNRPSSETRTFGQCKEKLSKLAVRNIQIQLADSPTEEETCNNNNNNSRSVEECFEPADYDSQDFVVHKASFPEDYSEEYEVELPEEEEDIPSPDYASDNEEEEFLVQHSESVVDPRRYIYYSDDKELEVIPEEDEDDIDDLYQHSDIYKRGGCECDSGLTDDQRSDDSSSSLHESPTTMSHYHKRPARWDPKELLEVLYRLDVTIEPSTNTAAATYINKEGYLDKLPSGRKKATYWNPWKTKFIKLKDGFLYCYDNNRSDKASMTLQLMGGHIDTLENKMLGVDDQKGHYLVLRCSDDAEIDSWERALRSQCAEDFNNAYTSPCLRPLSTSKNVIIIDFGSCSVRAGRLMSQPSLPQLFFPTVYAKSKSSGKMTFGIDALKPSIRKDSTIAFPLHPSAKVTKYSIDVSILPDLLKHIFKELNVYPEEFKVQLSMPRNLSLQTKIKIARMLLDDFKVKGINLTHQAILSLHAYNSKSGIIVDIGDRLDVIPIIEGYIVESGVTRLPYGGLRMIHHLKHSLAEKNISVVSDIESYLARYVLEQLCYVAEDYNEEMQRFYTNPDDFEMSISTSHFFNNECYIDEIILDLGRFHVAEGLFSPEQWGLDHPGLHQLVQHAIQECGVDLRREMSKSIYVSGGLTLLPGFVDRLEKEVGKLTPNAPKVHASNYRYHMSYIGACQIALEERFGDVCITKQMWRKEGNTCVKKWHI